MLTNSTFSAELPFATRTGTNVCPGLPFSAQLFEAKEIGGVGKMRRVFAVAPGRPDG
jgi:hypothetical protein